jgi:hypothetical protein
MKPEVVMDSKTLDRLLIDDALGALPEDVRALLAAYVAAAGPQAAAEAEVYRQTAGLARRALVQPSAKTVALPPFRAGAAHRTGGAWRWTGRAAALAASLAAGLGLGFLMFSHAAPAEKVPPPQVAIQPTSPEVLSVSSRPATGVQDFWSVRRLAGLPPEAAKPAAMPWSGPKGTGGRASPGENL